MKKTFITALSFLAIVSASAQGLSLRDRAQISRSSRHAAAEQLAGNKTSMKIRKAAPAKTQERVSALVRLAPDTDPASLGENVTVIPCRAGFSIVSMPATDVERIAENPGIKSFSLAKPVDMKLDRARKVSGVDKIHTGEGLPTKYTGRGVVAGVVDNGIDPNHINFLFPDGTSRVSMFSLATTDRNGNATTKIYTPSTLTNFTTDDATNYHGTHTLGILAGSYDGPGKMAYQTEDGFNLDENCSRTPYYGVAPAADLAVGGGSDYDAYIVYNIENILNYAAQTHQRAVINLSLGSSMGPHDGSTALNQYLDYISMSGTYEIDGQTYQGDNAIICISAGNEGDMPIAWNKTISETDPEAKSFYISLLDDVESDGQVLRNMRMGHMYVYGNDSRPFKVQLVAWNNKRNRAAWAKTLVESSNAVQYYCSESKYQQDANDVIDQAFANYFEGYVGFGTGIDEDNNRYFAVIDIAAIDNVDGTFNKNEEYSLGLIVTYIANDGTPQRIEAYGDADGVQGMGSLGKEGWIEPTGNGTISDMACGHNQIIVGSYNTRENWLSLDGNPYNYGEFKLPEGDVTNFSSWGTLYDGRTLPHVLAPGAVIISSSNKYYHDNSALVSENYNPQHPGLRQGETTFAGRDHYWVQMSGTSMSTPFVAGAMALWLEADPTLTVDDMRDIISRTSVRDEYTAKCPDQVKVGAGKFDAYAGLKEVLRRSSIVDVEAEAKSDDLIVRTTGEGTFEVCLPGAKSITAKLYDMLGRTITTASSASDEVILTAPAGAKGVYVVNVNDTASKKIIIK